MTSGFGVDRASSGLGTTSSDIRKIQGGLYSPGIISGCTISTSASAMQYTIAAGVVAISTGTGEIVLAPVAQTTISTSAATNRTDIVYVQQRYPSIEGDANVFVGVGTSLPSRAVELKRFTITSGNTNTNQAVATGGINYSIPYGATLGQLHYYQHTSTGLFGTLPLTLTRYGHGSFNLPTDRRLRFKLTAVLSVQGAAGFDNSKYAEYGFLPNINGGDFVLWSTGGLHAAWQTHYFEKTINVSAGIQTVNVGFTRLNGPGNVEGHYGTGSDGYGRSGIEFIVEDTGPTV